MPRPSKGARLYFRKRQGRAGVWVIRDDGGVERSTGTGRREDAEKHLARWLTHKHRPRAAVSAAELTIAKALTIYAQDRGPDLAAPDRAAYAIEALVREIGDMAVGDVTGALCRAYMAARGVSASTVRRELGVLQAAVNFCAREGHLVQAPAVWRPAEASPRQRWLTRDEAAWLLRGARGLRVDGRHLVRFILVGLYTGTRKSATLALRIDQPSAHGGWIDTGRGVLYRAPEGSRQTVKRQTPARLPRQLLAHVRRWKANGARFVVETHEGHRVGDVRKGWARAVRLAGEMAAAKGVRIDLHGITPHALKHTAITWAMQNGADLWDAASYFGTSVATLEKVYGHHHPDHQASAVRAMEGGDSR